MIELEHGKISARVIYHSIFIPGKKRILFEGDTIVQALFFLHLHNLKFNFETIL